MIGAWSQSGLLTTWRAARATCRSVNLRTSSARSANFCLQRRREQLLDRRDQVVEAIADVGDQRHLGEHDIAHAPVVDAHVDEFRAARHDRRRAVVLQLVADIDDDVGVLRLGDRVERAGRQAADPERMRLREVGVDLPRLRHRHAEHLGELHRLRRPPWPCRSRRRRSCSGILRLDQELGGALDLLADWAAPACADRSGPAR